MPPSEPGGTVPGNRKAIQKRSDGTSGKKRTGTRTTGTAKAKGGSTSKKQPAPGTKPGSGRKKPLAARAGTNQAANSIDLPRRIQDNPGGASLTPILRQQRFAGFALLIASGVGLAAVGIWVTSDGLDGAGPWALRVTVRGAGLLLIALCLWTYLGRRIAVSAVLAIGAGSVCLIVYEAGSALRLDLARGPVNRTLLELEAGHRDIAGLASEELSNPYVEAYAIMRDIYWELYLRCDDELSRYRTRYEAHTAGGTFLDAERLQTDGDLRRSIGQIDQLLQLIQRVESARPEISDLLLTIGMLDVDEATRSAYAADLRSAHESFLATTQEAAAREQTTLRAVRHALESLLDAEGRYRIRHGQLIFDDPADAARFAGGPHAK